MNKKIIFLSTLLLFVLLFSCKKNQLGGKSTISGKVAHHNKAIPDATVFIKFNATEFPGPDTTLYDDKVKADSEGNYTFKCYKGKYYLYGVGLDYGLQGPDFGVTGGVPVTIRHKEKVEADVAVTEKHI